MATALPQPVQLKLEQALAQWRHWHSSPPLTARPTVVAQLSGGRSNYAFHVEHGEQHFFLRLDGVQPASLALNRTVEYRAQEQAAQHGLAPMPRYFNPELGVLVSDWHQPQSEPPDTNQQLRRTAALLHAIHQLPALKLRLRPLPRARHYLNRGFGNRTSNLALSEEFLAACAQLDELPSQLLVCHNDLLQANRLWRGDRTLALDWEYAAMADPLFDLAVICEGDRLNNADASLLLAAYLELSGPLDSVQERLALQRVVYRELTRLWEGLTGR